MSQRSNLSSHHSEDGVVIDIGTGDGLFVYQSARSHPQKFFIGIDANPRPLEKISEKIFRKPAKGGANNALFLRSAVEDLPAELDGVADEVHVHFPWGSLLKAVAAGDKTVLDNIRRICAPAALLEVVIGVDPDRDRSEIERLGLAGFTESWIKTELPPRYRKSGFDLTEIGSLSSEQWSHFPTSWARRLSGGAARSVFYLIGRAV